MYDECFCCGERVRVDRKHWRVHLLTTGDLLPASTPAEEADAHPDSQGSFPVGPRCRKNYPGEAFRSDAEDSP